MPVSNRIRTHVIAVLLAASLATATATPAFASEQHRFTVAATEPRAAIREFAAQANVQIMVAGENVERAKLNPVNGDLSTEEGLKMLLAQSGLDHRYVGERSIAIVREQTSQARGRRDLRMAQAEEGSTPAQSAASPEKLEEVLVTAQKRAERLQDVPVPVTAINAATLINNNLVRTQDFYNRVPGLSFTPGDRGQLNLSIRGLTTGYYTVSTVGFVVDDIPFGASSMWMSAPEIDPNELASVEVLRGPQGTLYGANSMGGLVKYVTVDPSTDRVTGRAQVGLSSVHNGDDLGLNVRGAVNIPLSDTLAVRASGFKRRDPGYIDNPVRNEKGINEANASGGRFSALWRPSEAFSLKLGALVQNWSAEGGPYSFRVAGFGDLQQDLYPRSGEANNKTQVFNATLTAKFGAVDLTSVSAYSRYEWSGTLDDHVLLPFTADEFPGSGIIFTDYHVGDKTTQELRLSSSIGERFEWLAGAFYTHENYRNTFDMEAIDPATGRNVGYWTRRSDDGTIVYDEYAAFADLTVHFSDRFNVQFGGRKSHIKQGAKESSYGGGFAAEFFSVDPFVQTFPSVTDKPTTYLVTPQFKVSSDLMLYARLASGFRPGGANTFVAALNGAPPTYAPDKTQNYELGIKGTLLDGALSFDASVYRVDWKDIQLTLLAPNGIGTYNGNGGSARSQGLELSAETRSRGGLTVGGWFAYNDAELAEDLPPGDFVGRSGDRLPFSARLTGNLSVTQEFPITASLSGTVGGSFVYVGDRKESFVGPPPAVRLQSPSYTQIDLRAGLTFDSWDASLIVNNVADKRGILRPEQTGTSGFPSVIYIQPRTISLSVAKSF